MTGTYAPLRVLIVGGGMAALETLLALRHMAGDRVDPHLITAGPDFVYRPLLVAEPFGADEDSHRIPIATIARDQDAGHVTDGIVAVDTERRIARGTSGGEYAYDVLVVATGGRVEEALPGAISFHGPTGASALREALRGVWPGRIERLAFVVPPGPTWPLPMYELAMMTAAWAREEWLDASVALITPERRALAAFGDAAGDAMDELLERHGVAFHPGATAATFREGEVRLTSGDGVPADVAIATPRLRGPAIEGLPADDDGFIPTDGHGRVDGVDDVYAAGDAAGWAIKHGGLATMQADAVADAICERIGVSLRAEPFEPVLRGVVMAGEDRLFIRADTRGDRKRSIARMKPIWWPPAKVAGRYLAPYLEARGIRVPDTAKGGELGVARDS